MFSSKIFRSRWAALLWAGGILWTAYDVASAAPQRAPAGNALANAQSEDVDATGVAVDTADLAVLANAMSN